MQLDELFESAAKLVLQHGKASTSVIQRYLALGYGRAWRLLGQLEEAGVVGKYHEGETRSILIKNEEELNSILERYE